MVSAFAGSTSDLCHPGSLHNHPWSHLRISSFIVWKDNCHQIGIFAKSNVFVSLCSSEIFATNVCLQCSFSFDRSRFFMFKSKQSSQRGQYSNFDIFSTISSEVFTLSWGRRTQLFGSTRANLEARA